MRQLTLLMAILLAGLGTSPSVRAVGAEGATRDGSCSAALDAVAAAPGNHKILLENERVRVLDVVVPVGTREPAHEHCRPSVLYVMFRGKLREYDGTGRVVREEKDTPPPSAFPFVSWLPPGPPHAIENLDGQPVHLLRVELKE